MDVVLQSKPKGSIFTIKIWEGRNLAAKDEGGTSDPYCLYGFIDEKERWLEKGVTRAQKSCTIYKNLNPKWDTKYTHFEILSNEIKPNFKIQVWDKDKLADDFMGHFVLHYSNFVDGKSVEEWVNLEPREGKDEYISGEIKISYKYQSKETLMKEWNKIIAESKSQIDLNLSNHSIDEIKDNISSWIISIKDSDLFLDSLSALEKLFKWTEAKENGLLFQQFQLFPNLFIALTTRTGSPSKKRENDLALYIAISCGLIGNLAQNSQLHPDLFKYNLTDFCLRNIKIVSSSLHSNTPSLLLIIFPFYYLTSFPETALERKKEYIYGLTPALGDLLQELSEYNSKWTEVIALSTAVLANIAQNFGVDSFKTRIVPHIGKLFVNWVGNEEILSQGSIIIYCMNQSTGNEEYLSTLSSAVVHGLISNVLSQFPGRNFEESEQLVLIVIPLLALFTWICHPSVLTRICNSHVFAILSKVMKLYNQNCDICHNIINILYGCLTRVIKLYNRHQQIFTLGKEIVQILEEPKFDVFVEEFQRCGTLKLFDSQ